MLNEQLDFGQIRQDPHQRRMFGFIDYFGVGPMSQQKLHIGGLSIHGYLHQQRVAVNISAAHIHAAVHGGLDI
jgi:hypothetical protein